MAQRLLSMLSDKFFVNKNIFLLARGRLEYVKEMATHRLKDRPNNYASLYILSLYGYYKKDVEESFKFFSLLVSHHITSTKVQKWFIERLIPYGLYKQKKYIETVNKCSLLLSNLKKRKIQILLLKYLCAAQYSMLDYQGVFDSCQKLERLGFHDAQVEKLKKESEEKIYR